MTCNHIAPPPVRQLVEFETYNKYIGQRLYPRAGNLALVGITISLAFIWHDWLGAGDPFQFYLLAGVRVLSAGLMVPLIVLLKRGHPEKPLAPLTLYLGILSFLVLILNHLVFQPRLAMVTFILAYYMFGVHYLGPVLLMRHFVTGSILTVLGIAGIMAISGQETSAFWLVGMLVLPLQVFLGVAVSSARKTAVEQYETARQNYLLSRLDSMTQLLNRRTWYEYAGRGLTERQRQAVPLCFILLDIDHFKGINDRYGHDCGDIAIQLVADTLIRHSRNTDLVGRLGGEEFGILLFDTELSEAREIAERIRLAIETLKLEYSGQQLRITVSLGIAAGYPAELNLDELVKNGDLALYRAKHEGRNRIAF